MFEVRRVEFLDHLDAGAAVLRDLINVRAFHEAHTDVSVAQAVGGARVPVAIKFKFRPGEDSIEEFDMISRKDEISRLRQDRFRWCRRRGVTTLSAS